LLVPSRILIGTFDMCNSRALQAGRELHALSTARSAAHHQRGTTLRKQDAQRRDDVAKNIQAKDAVQQGALSRMMLLSAHTQLKALLHVAEAAA
jgi:hypothetical protein